MIENMNSATNYRIIYFIGYSMRFLLIYGEVVYVQVNSL